MTDMGNGNGLNDRDRGVTEAAGGVDTMTREDFVSDQEIRWCPGCGDYAILAAVQSVMPELGIPKEKMVWVSGIGCSSRFPYYMNTYGVHGIHGRAPAIATGIATARPDLSVWVVTGDGDGLSIGGNHLIHALRRNVNLTILMFNNQIYGLTKGQYSPTSEAGKVTKSTPFGSLEHPFNPLSIALGAEASFVARTIDVDRKHLPSGGSPRLFVHRDLPELQHLQRRSVHRPHRQGGQVAQPGLSRARQAHQVRHQRRERRDHAAGRPLRDREGRGRGRGQAARSRRASRQSLSCIRSYSDRGRADRTDSSRRLPRRAASRLR
jgi:hypothetical protein